MANPQYYTNEEDNSIDPFWIIVIICAIIIWMSSCSTPKPSAYPGLEEQMYYRHMLLKP